MPIGIKKTTQVVTFQSRPDPIWKVLGLGLSREHADTPLSIATGTTVVLFSDGLLEAHNKHGRAYGSTASARS